MNLVDDEEPPNLSIMRMGFGEVRPRKERRNATVEARNEDPSSSTRVEPSSSQVPQDQSHDHGDDNDHGMDQGGAQGEEAQDEAAQVERDDDCELIQPQRKCLIQECIKVYNGIIPMTIFLGVSEEE